MPNKNSNVPYDQIPHIVTDHPDTTIEDHSIMRCLYKILKNKDVISYSNEQLAIDSRVPKRSLQRRLAKLEEWGFIRIIGHSYARKIRLGLLFITCAKYDICSGENLLTRAKTVCDPRHGGAYNKNTNKKKKEGDFSQAEKQEIEWYKNNPGMPVKKEHQYLFEQDRNNYETQN